MVLLNKSMLELGTAKSDLVELLLRILSAVCRLDLSWMIELLLHLYTSLLKLLSSFRTGKGEGGVGGERGC